MNRPAATSSSPLHPGPKHAIVTGAASGLGRAICVRLARDGWNIAICDIDTDRAQETLSQVHAAGGSGQIAELDVSSADGWQHLRERLEPSWPALDLLVNNAGVACTGEVGCLALANWKWALDANLHGVIYGCHWMLPWIKLNPRGGHVVNVASIAGMLSPPAMGPYNVSKAGVIALSETMYIELRGQNIGVTVVCPGFFRTRLLDTARFDTPEQRAAANRYTDAARTSAEKVADAAVRAVGTRRLYVVEPRRARHLWRIKRLFPKALPNLFARAFGASRQSSEPAPSPAEVTGQRPATFDSAARR